MKRMIYLLLAALLLALPALAEGDLLPDEGEAHEHHFAEYVSDQNATCLQDGTKTAKCDSCDATDTIPDAGSALGHSFTKYVSDQNATCTEDGTKTAKCDRCDATDTIADENSKTGHEEIPTVTAPTCNEDGFTTYTCARCGETRVDQRMRALGHWYGEWRPNGDGTHTAECRRAGCKQVKTMNCAESEFSVIPEGSETSYTCAICPVCGQASDGAHLLIPERVYAEAATEKLPKGEIVLRMGELVCGERIMSVAFEYGGACTQPTGKVRITIPPETLKGYRAELADGEPLQLEFTEKKAAFELDFTPGESGAPIEMQILRLIPEI